MADFAETARKFAETWLWESKPVQGAEEQLLAVEQKLGIHLPGNYKQFIIEHGAPSTKWLLESITDGGHDLPDIQDFISVDTMVEATAMYELGGMDKGYIAFASDCMGNMFLFKLSDCARTSSDVPVYFFDHDFCDIGKIGDSFGGLLGQYGEVEYREG